MSPKTLRTSLLMFIWDEGSYVRKNFHGRDDDVSVENEIELVSPKIKSPTQPRGTFLVL